ncbi:hypothetical protein UFOVP1221_16 [uncultured Caudovirales phage]|uniref:Uncharacterized protein n=1 Tax=uncultured Caudovirales phage TaxID=2100421 RepID=A0A6J5R3D2_9CAUD|nr:hypothetical protein UFOVP491_8 [uncultured Caudovirales phage]CAB4191253.1 hypothetical protein UFOVP1221_16 [uncultured Caudovirales phage]
MGFLDNYEGNKERTDRWIATHPLGRLEAHIIEFNAEKGSILVQAKAWRNQEETEPAGIDYAFGYLAAYNANMKRWFVEDTVTSALMRVMALVMGGTEKATRETMQQVETMTTKVAIADPKKEYDYWTTKFGDVPSWDSQEAAQEAGMPTLGTAVNEIASQLGGELIEAAPECAHGHRIWKQAHEGAPKNWGGYFCTERTKATQCPPAWYVLASDGKWKPQV